MRRRAFCRSPKVSRSASWLGILSRDISRTDGPRQPSLTSRYHFSMAKCSKNERIACVEYLARISRQACDAEGYSSRCREQAGSREGRHRSSLITEDRLVKNDVALNGAATHSARRPKTAGQFFWRQLVDICAAAFTAARAEGVTSHGGRALRGGLGALRAYVFSEDMWVDERGASPATDRERAEFVQRASYRRAVLRCLPRCVRLPAVSATLRPPCALLRWPGERRPRASWRWPYEPLLRPCGPCVIPCPLGSAGCCC